MDSRESPGFSKFEESLRPHPSIKIRKNESPCFKRRDVANMCLGTVYSGNTCALLAFMSKTSFVSLEMLEIG